MDVLNFFTHLRGEDGQWSGWERDELSRLKAASGAHFENQIWEDGITDSGDPWIVAVDEDSLELSLHVARLNGAYVAVSGDLAPVASGANLKSVVNDCLSYIRSNRQETVSNDGATIRMPIGVSAAAFGIFLTERMTAFDEPVERDQTNLQLSKLGTDPNDSFVFLSGLATALQTAHANDPLALSPEAEALPGVGEAISDVFPNDGVDQMIIVEPPLPDHKTSDAKETDVARVTVESTTTAERPALAEQISDQTADVPVANGDATTSEGAQPVKGGKALVVANAPAQMTVGEDQVEGEVQPDPLETASEPMAVSLAGAVAVSGSPKPVEPSVRAASVEPNEYDDDTLPSNLSPLDHPPSTSHGVERLAVVWPASDALDDAFAI